MPSPTYPKRIARVPAVLCLALLTACSPKAIVKQEVVKQYPPAAWVQDCPIPPYLPGQPWSYVAQYAAELQTALVLCNCDKAKLRAWSAEQPTPKCEVAE